MIESFVFLFFLCCGFRITSSIALFVPNSRNTLIGTARALVGYFVESLHRSSVSLCLLDYIAPGLPVTMASSIALTLVIVIPPNLGLDNDRCIL